MSTPLRFGSAVSLAALTTMIAGCALPQHRGVATAKVGSGELGLASRAVAAMAAEDPATAIPLAERAVERTPDDASLRTLLGNAYFAAGRFLSAEGAYKDSLSLSSNQPQVILKLALVETALGKKAEALQFLHAGRSVLEAADYGLAVTLAGDPADGLAALELAARQNGADGRVRQNLALAYALSGDWTSARTVAAQDVPANLLDQRLEQWMQLASPKNASDQVASLVGVTPAVADQGRPERLALVKVDTRMAAASPVPAPVPAPAPQPVATAPLPQLALADPVVEPGYYPEAAQARPSAPAELPSAVEKLASAAGNAVDAIASAAAEAPKAVAALAPKIATAFKPADAPLARIKLKPARTASATLRRGKSTSVVQLGAYGSADRVLAAWNNSARKYPALRAYMPMSARFSSAKGTFYRLSVKGFGSSGEAAALCGTLRRSGGNCFVRQFAGDAPVRIASR